MKGKTPKLRGRFPIQLKGLQTGAIDAAEHAFVVGVDKAALVSVAGQVQMVVEGVKLLGDFEGIGIVDAGAPGTVVGVGRQGPVGVVVLGAVIVDALDAVDGCAIEGEGHVRHVELLEEAPGAQGCGGDDARGAGGGDDVEGLLPGEAYQRCGECLDARLGRATAEAVDFLPLETFSVQHSCDYNK